MTFADPRIVTMGTNKMIVNPGSMATHVTMVVTPYDEYQILKKNKDKIYIHTVILKITKSGL